MVNTSRETQYESVHLIETKESSVLINKTRNLALAILSSAGISGCAVYIHPSSECYSQPYYDSQSRVVERVYVAPSPVYYTGYTRTIVIWWQGSHKHKKHRH